MLSSPRSLRIVAIQGSARPNNNTAKALALVESQFSQNADIDFSIINPAELTLHVPGFGVSEDARNVQKMVKEADGIILATPEYHGSYSSTIKLVIDNLGFPSALAGKPIALLGVASGSIGAIKALEHLRSVASHVGGIVFPGPISVARVNTVFDEEGRLLDEATGNLVRSVADRLMDYIQRHICPAHTLEQLVRASAI